MAYASFSRVAVVSAALSLFTPAAAHLFQCPNYETVWITPEGTQYGICDNTDYRNGGGSLAVYNCVPSTQECLKLCIKDSRCKKAVYDKKNQMCHLKNNDKTAEMDWADDNGFDVIHRDEGSELDNGAPIKTCPNTGAGYSSGKTFFTVCVNTDYTGPNAHTFRNAPSPHACADTCAKTKDCKKAVYDVKNKICYVKESGSNVKLDWVKDERFISIDTKTGAADDTKDSDEPVGTKPETPKGAAAKVGQWSDVIKLPLIPVAAYIVPAYPEPARMLFFSSWGKDAFGGASGKTQFGDYEFATGAVSDREVANTHHDMFCPGISQLEDGRVMVQGGSDAEAVSIYDPATNEFTRGPDMKVARGYQTSAIMSNGRVFTIGGAYAGSREAKNGEVFNPDNQEWTYLPGADVKPMMTTDHEGVWREDNHAWLFGWKNESIFQAGPSLDQHWYSTEGEGSVVKAGTRDDHDAMCGVWAMYDAVAGKILSAGGAPEYTDSDATARAHITTIGEAFAPSVVERVPDMASPRGFANAVVLPDGTVLVTGGQRRAVVFTNTDAVLTAELFNPTTKTWTQLAAAATGAADDNNKDSDDPVDTKPETPKGAAAKVGQWSDVIKLPLIPVAAYIVPAYPEPAKMLFFSSWGKAAFGGASGKTQFGDYEFVTGAVWDREVANTHHDMFCPGISQLEDGRVMVQGGSDAEAVSIYDPATNEFTRGPDMKVARGYQTSAIMSNGHVFTIGGAYAGSREAKNGEVFNPDNQEWTYLPGADVKPMMTIDHEGVWREDNHAWLFGWKNESIFQAGPSLDQHWYSTEGEGSVVKAGTRDDDDAMCGVWAMYDAVAGKILSAGGAPEYTDSDATARAHITTVGEAFAPSVVERVPDMASPRGFANAVVLPDGTVLVTGGQRRAVVFTNTDAVLTAEIFNPTTKTWTQLAAAAVPRNYHSVSILLPDATVFTGGGGLCYVSTIGGSTAGCNKAADHADGEIFSPPYLFNDDGSAAPRPAISGLAQEAVSAGATLSFDVEGNVASFSLIRTGTVTHSVNSDQRRIPLKRFRAQNGKYTVTLPTDRGVLLPGYYYLFAISAKGVPSVAKSVHVVL
ncbi:hypothetical protein BN1723_003713 [Verticillium longisporum]|uniref:Apple domain-containing protein n=1 Tax=Verticillium longisporum TaxID=100787 RepID=A0A0G4MAI0_VERLO|nr:hypothetical protein BN1723_003713 [Verticillium longisporum]